MIKNAIIKFKNGGTLKVIKDNGATRGLRAKLYPPDYYIDTKIIDEIVTPLCVKEFDGVNSENQILYASSAFKRRNSIMKIITNPDKELVLKIREKLKENDNYCPCRLEKSADTKCICREFREKIEQGETGECHCGLYLITEEE